jgi:hypothetical protein
VKIEGVKLDDGRVFFNAADVIRSLRSRADDFDRAAAELGEPLDGKAFTDVVAHHAVATELRARADWLDVATVAHPSEQASRDQPR